MIPGNLEKLTTHLLDHCERRLADRLHRERREGVREHGADEQAAELERLENVDGEGRVHGANARDVGAKERERDERGRADREALADRGGGVAGGVERVGALAHFRRLVRHLGETAGVVGDRAVGVDTERDAERAQHADRRDADAIHAGESLQP
jgi:hypothetical protein